MKPQDYEQLWAELETLYFLPLSKGRFAVIDAADAHISLVKWTYVTGGYAIRGGQSGARSVLMHHLVLAPSKNMVISIVGDMSKIREGVDKLGFGEAAMHDLYGAPVK